MSKQYLKKAFIVKVCHCDISFKIQSAFILRFVLICREFENEKSQIEVDELIFKMIINKAVKNMFGQVNLFYGFGLFVV